MALAAALHHSRDVGPVTYNALRSQKTARAREWVQGASHGEDPEAPTSQEPGTQHFFLDDDSEPELARTRPDEAAGAGSAAHRGADCGQPAGRAVA